MLVQWFVTVQKLFGQEQKELLFKVNPGKQAVHIEVLVE